jgi:excisionase family DNA binding protein
MSPIDTHDVRLRKPHKRLPPREAPERLIDSDEAAAIIGIHPKTLQKYARRGLIRGVHVGKLWRFRCSTIEEWIVQEELAR